MTYYETKKLTANRAKLKKTASKYARAALDDFERGDRIIGLSNGKFSLVDMIAYLVKQKTGPADLFVSSWTAALKDVQELTKLRDKGLLRHFVLMVDKSVPGRGKGYIDELGEAVGSIVLSNVHAKFAIIRNDEWNIVIRTSMNLNRNTRIEQFDVDDDADIAEYFVEFMRKVSNNKTMRGAFRGEDCAKFL